MASFGELTNSGAMPALEAAMKFAAQRQRLTAHNIANITTPNFQTLDVSVGAFQEQLQRAVKERRQGSNPGESLHLRSTAQVKVDDTGDLTLKPGTPPSGNILFHDRNNRDPEALMRDSVENVTTYRLMAELLRSRHDLLRSAIAERP